MGTVRTENRASLVRSALVDSAVEVTIFVDRFWASGCAFVGVIWIWGIAGARIDAVRLWVAQVSLELFCC